ncbi:hypothetical protein QBK99_13610 [Corticibacterium sp. UT-5YL-CI-8]|nr:hypothetical protein [Tianweitania sp. UT-5YL-CI-8]
MKDYADNVSAIRQARRLSDAVRDAKNAAADKADVIAELREIHRTRLDMLVAELEPVFADVPSEIDSFDFAISSGMQPRLWIDAVAHVGMGRDGRTYRFLRDTRIGRVILAESSQVQPIADHVTRYIAERMVERERMLEGRAEAVTSRARGFAQEAEPALNARDGDWLPTLRGMAFFALGTLLGLSVSVAVLWDRILPFLQQQ